MPKLIDLTGQTFGYLTVIERAENSLSGKVRWRCKCKCGKEAIVNGSNLRNGNTKSCGCYQKERVSESNTENLIGQTFGHLTVVARDYINKNSKCQSVRWLCQCDCGNPNLKSVAAFNLKNGHVSSCGCQSNISKGEYKIAEILTLNDIPFISQKTFEDCVYENNYKAKFDFYVDNKYIIEYDGEQHFKLNPNSIWNERHSVEQTQKNDNFKNQWCKDKNIPIIRIPYTHYNELCLNDLLLETSQFIIKQKE